MDDKEVSQAHAAVWEWFHYFEKNGVTGQPAPLPSLKIIVDYAIHLEEENGRLMIEAGYCDPRLRATIDGWVPGPEESKSWWTRVLKAFWLR